MGVEGDLDPGERGRHRHGRAAAHRAARGSLAWPRTASGGATSTASTSRAPRPWTATATAAASSTRRAKRHERRAGCRRPRRRRGRTRAAASGRWSAASAAPPRSSSAAAATRSPSVTPERVAEEELLEPLRRVGGEREQGAEAHEPGHRDGRAGVGADARVARRERDQRGRHERAAGGAEQQRRAGERGEHQAGQQPVRERLGAVGEPLRHDPEAERAAQRARPWPARAARAGRCRSGAGRSGSRSPPRVSPRRARARGAGRSRRRAALSRISSWPYVAWSVSRSSVAAGSARRRPGGGSGTAPGRTSGRSPRRGSPRAACGPRRAARRRRASIRVGAGGVDAGQRLVEQQHRGVLDERAGEQGALALAARQLAEADARLVGQPDAVERRARGVARRRGSAAATSGRSRACP